MIETLLHAILQQVEQPKKDLEHNLRALLNEAVSKNGSGFQRRNRAPAHGAE